eukprot:CAMPEP_0115124028 /NCGR_PEP_ID=MMETSP0227-20121206/47998_1 /TAXON_ID=89957 /ORGANISM="Polarella glacialis, Strain CCMP 1383" /LENGTH=176 /DNA_ID=CAMNT_0002526721 /DNA_START=62 /DNA_END=592 /DNA_ORIENTATION=+
MIVRRDGLLVELEDEPACTSQPSPSAGYRPSKTLPSKDLPVALGPVITIGMPASTSKWISLAKQMPRCVTKSRLATLSRRAPSFAEASKVSTNSSATSSAMSSKQRMHWPSTRLRASASLTNFCVATCGYCTERSKRKLEMTVSGDTPSAPNGLFRAGRTGQMPSAASKSGVACSP